MFGKLRIEILYTGEHTVQNMMTSSCDVGKRRKGMKMDSRPKDAAWALQKVTNITCCPNQNTFENERGVNTLCSRKIGLK